MAYDGSLVYDTKIDPTGFTNGVNSLEKTAMRAISSIGLAFASGAIVKGIATAVKSVSDYGSTINDMSQKMGLATQAYQKWSYVLRQNGADISVLQMGTKTLSNAVVDGSKAFDKLDISLEKARSLSTEDLFELVVSKLAGMEAGSERTATAVDLLGRSATELLPVLNLGAAGIDELKNQASDYGLILSDEAVAASDDFGDALELAKSSAEGLKNTIVTGTLPSLTKLVGRFSDLTAASAKAFAERGLKGAIDVITDRFPVAAAAASGLVAALSALLIIKVVTAAAVAFQTAQVALALGMMKTTAAALAQSGALSILEVVVGLVTGKLSFAAAAQAILNAVMNANPVMLLVTAIGLLVGSVVLLNKRYEQLHPELQQTREEVDALTKSVADSSNAYEDSVAAMDSQQRGADTLISTLEELSESYSGSSVEQAKMQAIIDELNETYEGLNLSFDVNTGKLSQNADAVRNLVSAQIDAARKTATLNRYTQLLSDQQDAEYEMRKAQKAFYAAGDQGIVAQRKTNQVYRDAISVYNQVTAELEDCNGQLVAQNEAVQEIDPSLNILGQRLNETADATDRVIIGGYDFTDSLSAIGMTADQVSDRLNNFTGAATNLFEKIDTKARIRVKTMIENLTSNTAAIEQWGDNIALLGAKLPDDLLQPLIDQGPAKMAGVLNALAKASPEELDSLVSAFSAGGDAAKQAWLDSLGAGITAEENPLTSIFAGATDEIKKVGDEAAQQIATSIQEQDYESAVEPMTTAFQNCFTTVGTAFSELLERIHYDLAEAIGGVSIDIAQMARDVNRALASIKTSVTIKVNVIYSSSGSSGGSGSGTPTGATTGSTTSNTGAKLTGSKAAGVVAISSVTPSASAPTVIKNTNVDVKASYAGAVESESRFQKRMKENISEVLYVNT